MSEITCTCYGKELLISGEFLTYDRNISEIETFIVRAAIKWPSKEIMIKWLHELFDTPLFSNNGNQIMRKDSSLLDKHYSSWTSSTYTCDDIKRKRSTWTVTVESDESILDESEIDIAELIWS